jgi:CysZ protein
MTQDAFFSNLGNLIQGYKLIFRPGIRRYAFIPILINLVLFIILYGLGMHYFQDFLAWVNPHLPSWLHWLNNLLWVIFAVAMLLATSYSFTFLANLIAAPFNGLLAEQIELALSGQAPNTDEGLLALLKDAPRSMKRQLRYLGYYLPRALGILLLFFMPGGQIILAPLWFLFNAWTLALQYMDYPMDNHKIDFQTMYQQLKGQRLNTLGFGISLALASMIPILNLLLMPAAVAAAVQLWLAKFKIVNLTDANT